MLCCNIDRLNLFVKISIPFQHLQVSQTHSGDALEDCIPTLQNIAASVEFAPANISILLLQQDKSSVRAGPFNTGNPANMLPPLGQVGPGHHEYANTQSFQLLYAHFTSSFQLRDAYEKLPRKLAKLD
ncbi:hypothetical protein ACJJTC_002261 [Scirpophaga incertulas]